MRKSKLFTVLIVATATILLAACSQKNPLKKPDKKATAKFLMSATIYARQKLKLADNSGCYIYRDCMDGKADKSVCSNLYAEMLNYAKKSKNYSALTLSDLTNKQVWLTIKPDYQAACFNSD